MTECTEREIDLLLVRNGDAETLIMLLIAAAELAVDQNVTCAAACKTLEFYFERVEQD
jgi:hypothetical protein